jgi:phenylpropionate dioxygenase-like ring-hydroxylating dioxygenase large terminal subunit
MPGETSTRPQFAKAEVDAVFGGAESGLSALVPARCYWDPQIYAWEVEHILKKQWLAIGRWDWAEHHGDYFTTTMFGNPLVVTRDRDGTLHCLVNSCRHRYSQIVDDGSGNVKLLMCPYHRWTYGLDGRLRGVSVEEIKGLDRAKCSLPSIRLEVWQGTIFINFDSNAAPLGPQLAGLEPYIGRFKLGEMRLAGRTTYDTTWNYKLSFETGYEAYHHAGLHNESIQHIEPAQNHEALAFGDIWGIYAGRFTPEYEAKPEWRFPFGRPPWMSDEEFERPNDFRSFFIAVYPGLITYISPHQISMITTEHRAVDTNRASTHISIAPWAFEREGGEAIVKEQVEAMKHIQTEDTYGCRMLQQGSRASINHSVLHPRFESTLQHYHRWLLQQYLTA